MAIFELLITYNTAWRRRRSTWSFDPSTTNRCFDGLLPLLDYAGKRGIRGTAATGDKYMTSTKYSRIAHQRASSAPTVIPPVLRAYTQPPTQFARPRGLRVQGATDQSGTPYVEFVNRDTSLFTPLADVHSNSARAALESHNIILTKAEWDNLRADIDKLADFPPRSLAKRAGWTGPCHVLSNGTVFAPPGTEPAVAAVRAYARQVPSSRIVRRVEA